MNNINPKIVALSCSPSKGRNSDSMLDAFIEGILKNKPISVEKKYLKDIEIEDYSFENRNGPLPHETDFSNLVEEIKHSQGLIIATPTYNFSVPSHVKNFIDRIRFFALDLNNKNYLGQPTGKLGYLKTYFLVSGGTPTWAQRILFFAFPPFWLRSVFLYYGSVCFGAIYSGDVRTFENAHVLNKCRKAGFKYGKKLIKNSKNPLLEKLFWRAPQNVSVD